jgi:hypothetical protein
MKRTVCVVAMFSFGLVFSTDSALARPRVTLGQCIGSYDSCMYNCALGSALPPPWGGLSDYQWAQCRNRCWDNHAACVDLAFSARAVRIASRRRCK